MSEIEARGSVGASGHANPPPIQLADEASFLAHPWVERLIPKYERDSALARHAMHCVTAKLSEINELYSVIELRTLFTSIEGRVKTQRSFFRKLHAVCKAHAAETGITPQTLQDSYNEIKDLCGVRFACPYYDEIIPAITHVRSFLGDIGYAVHLSELPDKDHLEDGDPSGYRSYHFFLKVPTTTTIYGDVELCICEVQVRSELQHIWAVKSHDLLYETDAGWQIADRHVVEDMRQLSNSLRAADQALLSIRDRSRGER